MVTFVAAQSDARFIVSVEGKSCETPCTLSLPAVRNRVTVTGDARFRQTLPLAPGAARVTIEKRSGGMLALGITSLAVGGGTALVGVGVGLATGEAMLAGLLRAEGYEFRFVKGGLIAGGVGATIALVGGLVGLTNRGHNRLVLETGERADSVPRLVGADVAPPDGGLVAGASFVF